MPWLLVSWLFEPLHSIATVSFSSVSYHTGLLSAYLLKVHPTVVDCWYCRKNCFIRASVVEEWYGMSFVLPIDFTYLDVSWGIKSLLMSSWVLLVLLIPAGCIWNSVAMLCVSWWPFGVDTSKSELIYLPNISFTVRMRPIILCSMAALSPTYFAAELQNHSTSLYKAAYPC